MPDDGADITWTAIAKPVTVIASLGHPDGEVAVFEHGEIHAIERAPDGGVRRLKPRREPAQPHLLAGHGFDTDAITITLLDADDGST